MSRRAGVSPADTRRALLDATIDLLAERGVRGLRVSEVARRAGVSTGAIYSQFESKTALVMAAVRDRTPLVIAEHVASGDHASVLELFAAVARSLPERAADIGPLLLEVVVSAARDPDIAGLVTDQFGANEANSITAIRLAQEEGEIDPTLDPVALGRLLSMISLGSLVTTTLGLPAVEESAWDTIVRRLLDAARPRDPSGGDLT